MMGAFAAALGTFDGVHLGHREVLNGALHSGLTPLLVSFRLPPKAQMGIKAPLLTLPQEKEELLRQMGFAHQEYLEFSQVRQCPPGQFLDDLCARYPIKMFCCGFNYRFGKNGAGDTAFLQAYCKEKGIRLQICNSVQIEGQTVSSTAIRQFIEEGRVDEAAKMLGRYYAIKGVVRHGDARGRTMGFPTVNQAVNLQLAVPRFGVYAARCTINGQTYKAVTNLGMRPTFSVEQPIAETHICDFTGDLYGQELQVELLKFLRPEQKFDGLQDLQAAIAADMETAKNI